MVCRAVVWQLCGGVRGREAWRVACVSAGRREESREIQILPPRGRTSSKGFLANGLQLTSPPTAKSTQAVTSGQSQLAFAFLGGSPLHQREQPTALQGMPAMHLRPAAMRLRRAATCTSTTAAAYPRARSLTHSAACRLARLPSRAAASPLTPLARRLLHVKHCLGARN